MRIHASVDFKLAAFLVLATSLAPGCGPSVACGPGTHREGAVCVLDTMDAGLRDAGASDAGLTGDAGRRADGGPRADAGPASLDAGGLACASQCDCPSNTVCSIEGACEGDACVPECRDAADCPCGRACVDGYCDFGVGSLGACTMDCECPNHEVCAGGRCQRRCGRGVYCTDSSQCSACGSLCEHFTGACGPPETCSCTQSCFDHGLRGQICNTDARACERPPGELLRPAGGPTHRDTFLSYVLDTRATATTPGAVSTISVVIDAAHDTLGGYAGARLTAPDGSTHSVALEWRCRGASGGEPWDGKVELIAPVMRPGEWRIQIGLSTPETPATPPVVRDIWVYLGP